MPKKNNTELYIQELASLVESNANLHFLEKNLQELKEKTNLSKLLSCYRLSLLTLNDQNQQLTEACKKLSIQLEEFAIPSKALDIIPEKQKEEYETKIKHLQTSFEEVQAEKNYLQQDFDNHKKRTEKQIQDIIQNANEQLILKLLPVLDNLERALAYPETSTADAVVNGVSLIKKQFEEILEKEGLHEISALGNHFDPTFHEAADSSFTDTVPEETVVEQLRKGYCLREKVIRPALVKVAKASKSKNNFV